MKQDLGLSFSGLGQGFRVESSGFEVVVGSQLHGFLDRVYDSLRPFEAQENWNSFYEAPVFS